MPGVLHFGACPPIRSTASSTGPSLPPPSAKWVRYPDPKLQEIYARIYTALRTKDIPIYGKVFSETDADSMARQLVDAIGAAISSKELQNRVECIVAPIAAAGARKAVGRLLQGTFVAGMLGLVGYAGWKIWK